MRPPAHAPPAPIRRVAYAGCAGVAAIQRVHLLCADGVPGLEPDGFRPTAGMAVALCAGPGLAGFLLLGLVCPWGMVFPRWTVVMATGQSPLPADRPGLADRPHLRAVRAGAWPSKSALLPGGVLRWHGRTGIDAVGYIGVAQTDLLRRLQLGPDRLRSVVPAPNLPIPGRRYWNSA